MTTTPAPTTWFVVPCGAAKLDTPAAARDLYTSPTFRHILAAAVAEAAATERDLGTPTRVLILSARHGLVDLDTVLAPYDTVITDADRIDRLALAWTAYNAGVRQGDEVYAMLPNNYLAALDEALGHHLPVWNVYEAATRGIGDHRGVATSLLRTADQELAA